MPVIIWFFCHFYYEIPYVARSNTLGTLSWNSGGEKSEFRAIYKGYCFIRERSKFLPYSLE